MRKVISGYWQVEITEEDTEKTAFCVLNGPFQFNVMLLGLSNATAIFKHLMDTMLADLQWER